MSEFSIHASVEDLINSFRARRFHVAFTVNGSHQMLVRGPNNKEPYTSALRFSDLQTASAWLQGYDYANKELTGKSK